MNISIVLKKLEKDFEVHKAPIIDLLATKGSNHFKILIATLLSSRTKDKVTKGAVNKLFARIKKPADLSKLTVSAIEKLIYPVGFYKVKARQLKKLAKNLEENFASNVPDSLENLTTLPGVGRKTANLVLAVAFKKPAICVDVHVHRISNRLGYVKTKSAEETERALRKKLPKKWWIPLNRLLVSHGQRVCKPISPKCSECSVEKYCAKVGVYKV